MKHLIYTRCLVCACLGVRTYAATPSENYQLSTHILDVNLGRPASGVPIVLFRLAEDGITWNKVDAGITDQNGRIGNFLPANRTNDGIYKLKFETRDYFRKQNRESIYPFVEVVFEIRGSNHYHIPITMSANGYGTYRGN